MCFAVPYRISGIRNNSALIENGRIIKLGKGIKAKKGDFLQIVGNIAVRKISQASGQKIRKLIKKLNT